MIRALHQVPFENCLDAGLSTLFLFHGGAFGSTWLRAAYNDSKSLTVLQVGSTHL